MINLLIVKNIALIQQVELRFSSGLTLLTGETGSGKSILVDALSLLLGARATSDLIRSGETVASVEASFEISDALRQELERRGLPADGDEVVVRRELSTTGRGKATVNGALVPVSVLKELSPLVVTIYGQHEPQGLLDPAAHLAKLDRFAAIVLDGVGSTYRELRRVEERLQALRRDRREFERRRETLEFQAAEIEKAGLEPDEEARLRQEKAVCQNAGRLAVLCGEAHSLLHEDEVNALSTLGQVFRRVEELASIEPRFEQYVKSKTDVLGTLQDLALFLRDYADDLDIHPGRLDEIETRLAVVDRLKRRYGSTLEEILAFGRRCREELQQFGSPEEQEQLLERQLKELSARYVEAAREISTRRHERARELEGRMERELRQLAMERTRFKVGFEPAEAPIDDRAAWREDGWDVVEFLLAPNAGEELRPLARIASGGELSRILLALSCAAPLEDERASVIFDEVDAGIGGRVAEVVGRKLAAVARQRQVLCVTHLPQIAAFADAHYLVSKAHRAGRTLTSVETLSEDARVEELARMVGGEKVSETARRHAGELLRSARV
jgi:DNA repair protein RecN (Recombination protein N)